MKISWAILRAALAATLLLTSLAGVANARWLGPTVYAGWRDGPVAVPSSGAMTTLGGLAVPAGKWIAWAKLYLANESPTNGAEVTCVLNSRGGDGHQGTVFVGPTDVPTGSHWPRTRQPVGLTTSAAFGRGGGTFALRCNAPIGGAQLTANWIKITAMQAGTLKLVDMAKNSASTSGSGKPEIVLAGQPGPITVPFGQSVTVGKVQLPAGRWWVRASFTIKESSALFYGGECRLLLGRRMLDRKLFDGQDAAISTVVDSAFNRARSSATVKIRCSGGTFSSGVGQTSVSDVRISAVGLGTLVTYDGDASSKSGSGQPYAEFAARDDAQILGSWTQIQTLPVSAGYWMFLGKAEFDGSVEPTCQLVAGVDFDQNNGDGYLTFPFAVVHRFDSSGTGVLRCRASKTGLDGAMQIRLTAFKLGSLKNVPLN